MEASRRHDGGGISRFLRGNVLGLVAIFIALCGTATALPHREAIRSKDIANGSVRAVDLAPNAVTSPKVAPDTLTGADIREGTLDFGDDDEDAWFEDDPVDPDDPEDIPLERASCSVTGTAADGDVLLRCDPLTAAARGPRTRAGR